MAASRGLDIRGHLLILCLLFPLQIAQEVRSTITYEYRLIDGNTPYEGRLEVRRNGGVWGTIYGFYWKLNLSSLACRSLGFSSALSASIYPKYGSSSGPVHLRVEQAVVEVCPGNATSILDCKMSAWDDHMFVNDHSADVGLVCLPANSSLTFRLASEDGNNNSGIVEVFNGVSEWGHICGSSWESNWEMQSHAICRHLGYQFAISTYTRQVVSPTSIFVLGYSCRSYSLADCTPYRWFAPTNTCPSIAGVVCFQGDYLDQPYTLRKAGTYSGILEASLSAKEDWRQLCVGRDIAHQLRSNQYNGKLLCSDINEDGRYEVHYVDNCSPTELQESKSYAKVPLPVITNSSLEMKPLGDIVSFNGNCIDMGYQSVVISCIRDVLFEDVPFRYYQEFSCEGRCGYDISAIYCRCDSDCGVFKDCCYDYHEVCSQNDYDVKTSSLSPDLFSCFPFDQSGDSSLSLGSYLLVSKCPSAWINSDIRFLCEGSPLHDIYLHDYISFAQTISNRPVFDANGNNYVNIFCAICNNNALSNIEPWHVEFTVEMSLQFPGQSLCNKAKMIVDGGNRVGRRLRYCTDSTIDSCPDSSNMSAICQSYSAIICPVPGVYAKNIHCAICNGYGYAVGKDGNVRPCFDSHSAVEDLDPTSHWNCNGFPVVGKDARRCFDPVFHSLWNFQGSVVDVFDIDYERCSKKEEIFDPFAQNCRSLSCSPGYEYDALLEMCRISLSFSNAVHGMCCAQQQTWIGYITEMDKHVTSEKDDCVVDYLNMVIGSHGTKWEYKRVSKDSTIDIMLYDSNSMCNIADKLDESILTSDYLLSKCNKYSLDYLHICGKYVTHDICNGQWFKDEASEFQLVNYTHIAEIFKYKDAFILPSLVIDYISYDFNFNSQSFRKTEMVLVCGIATELLKCPSMVTLSVEEYEMFVQNQSYITVLSNQLTLKAEDFILFPDGRVQICSSYLHNTVPQVFNYFGKLGVVNIIGSCLSLVASFIVFAVHCKYKNLRKYFQGRATMFLSAMLFLAYLLPIVTQKIRIVGYLCYLIALLTHYAWLSVFSWFTVISLSMTYTFVLRPFEQRDTREKSTLYRFILPVCGLLVPFAIIIVCFVADMSGIQGFSYGVDAPCWISGPRANLFAFGIPVGFSLMCNTLCFIATATTVCRSERRSRKLKNNDKILTWKDIMITLKMSTLMGIGWVLGFIASFSGSIPAWWIFICITSFYGIFLVVGMYFSIKRKIRPIVP